MPQESFFDFVRGYQDSHDCSDDDMLQMLCNVVEGEVNQAVMDAIKECFEEHDRGL